MSAFSIPIPDFSLPGRIGQLLSSYEWVDCTFDVKKTKFQAHKLILTASSPVFKAMFYGPLAKEETIIIPDIEPDVFQLMLDFIYTDKIHFERMEQAFGLLYASHKYMIEYMGKQCKKYIEANICIETVLAVFEHCDYLGETRLREIALTLIVQHPETVFCHYLEEISPMCMKAILESDIINIHERDLINFVFEWTMAFCNKNNIPPTLTHRRDVLINHGLHKLLRFLSLNEKEFNEIKPEFNILLPYEVLGINNEMQQVCNSRNSNSDTLGNNYIPLSIIKYARRQIDTFPLYCCRSSLRSTCPLNIYNIMNSTYVRIRSDRTIFITSLVLPTRMSAQDSSLKEYIEHIIFTFYSDGEAELNNDNMHTINGIEEYDNKMKVDLRLPFKCVKNNWYRIKFTWPTVPDDGYKYMMNYRDSVCNGRAKLEFQDDDHKGGGTFLERLKFFL